MQNLIMWALPKNAKEYMLCMLELNRRLKEIIKAVYILVSLFKGETEGIYSSI